MRTTPALGATAVLVVALLSASCGADDDTGETNATAGGTSAATAEATTTTTSSSTSATAVAAPPPPVPSVPLRPSDPADGTSPLGSGCNPGGDVLPDGTWFGVLEEVDPTSGSVGLDLGCFFVGDAANAAAAEAGGEVPVNNDYFVSNVNPMVFDVAVWPNAVVLLVVPGSSDVSVAGTGAGAAASIPSSPLPMVWLQITDGRAIVVQQQYLP